jgi:cytochrome c biogenesis protein CcdA/thiol-disulfide isomerase/thioredoxin
MTRKIIAIATAIAFVFILFSPLSTSTASGLLPTQPLSVAQQADNEVVIYFFWGDGCPHCAKAKPVLEGLATQYPSVKLYEFEIYYNEDNQKLFSDMGAVYGIEPRYVPTILIGDMVWEGYTDEFSQEITSFVERSLVEGSVDKGAAVIEGKGYIPFGASATAVAPTPAPTKTPGESTADNTNTRKLPLFGEVDFSKMGLFLSTALIAFVDGFNPCSLWVLSMLLAITMHTGSRKKVLVIGLVFLTVTAAIYALFIAGLFTVLKVVSFVGWIQVVVALVALFFGLVNIKDYFFYKEGVSFTISDDQKPGIYQRIRKVMDAGDSWWGLIGGTVVLAAGVSLVEFTCTAGFPVLWTNLVSSQQVTTITFVMLLLLYMLIYQLDELGIFLVAAFTLKSSRIEEKHGRILKLIGGVLMLTLAIVMLVKPELMSDVGKSLIVFGIAFAITLLILLVHRVILPKKGIHIGTENSKRAAVKSRRKTRRH